MSLNIDIIIHESPYVDLNGNDHKLLAGILYVQVCVYDIYALQLNALMQLLVPCLIIQYVYIATKDHRLGAAPGVQLLGCQLSPGEPFGVWFAQGASLPFLPFLPLGRSLPSPLKRPSSTFSPSMALPTFSCSSTPLTTPCLFSGSVMGTYPPGSLVPIAGAGCCVCGASRKDSFDLQRSSASAASSFMRSRRATSNVCSCIEGGSWRVCRSH